MLTRVVLDNVVEGATRGAEARREAFSALAVALLVRRVTVRELRRVRRRRHVRRLSLIHI